MKKNLPEALRDHYGEARLSGRQLAALKQLRHGANPRRGSYSKWIAFAAIAGVLCLVAYGLFDQVRRDVMLRQIVAESINSHTKNMIMDVNSASLMEVRAHLNELEFQLQTFALLRQPDLKLQGGRYCSLLGTPAALLRLQDPTHSGGHYTLYQVPLPKTLAHLERRYVQREQDGISVSMWAEKGVLLVLAGDQSATLAEAPVP